MSVTGEIQRARSHGVWRQTADRHNSATADKTEAAHPRSPSQDVTAATRATKCLRRRLRRGPTHIVLPGAPTGAVALDIRPRPSMCAAWWWNRNSHNWWGPPRIGSRFCTRAVRTAGWKRWSDIGDYYLSLGHKMLT